MRFVIVFMLAATADFLWAGYISAVSGKQAVRAAAWSMAIAIVGGVVALNCMHAPVLLVSLAAGSFVGTYLSVVSENGKAIRHHSWLFEKSSHCLTSFHMRKIPMRFIPVRWSLLGVFLIATLICGGTGLVRAVRANSAGHEQEHTVFSAQLPNVPGKTVTAIVVGYAPGGSSPAHRHAGSVLAYVLSGQIRSENSATGPARVYRAGEAFFEPPGSTHLISANASDTEPASLLAVFIVNSGDDPLTTPDPKRGSR